MSTYCISDIHGCHDEFIYLLEEINFDPTHDTLYVIGDVIDRGDRPIDCLRYIMNAKNSIHLLRGNHEIMMLDYFSDPNSLYGERWFRNGNKVTLEQLCSLPGIEREKILRYVRGRPLYKTVAIAGKRYFLSHAGLDASIPFIHQETNALVWSREEFHWRAALKSHTCVFGHTPTFHLRVDFNCSVWRDTDFNDKICIDCGCVFGGALSALRLDDLETFYVKSHRGRAARKFYIEQTAKE